MNEPIRIAQVIGKMKGGGVEAVVMNYYRYIDRRKIQFDFIIDKDSNFFYQDEIERLGGRIYVVEPYQHLTKNIRDLKRVFKVNNYKIVHSHLNTLSVFSLHAAKRAKVPIRIAHSHSSAGKGEFKRNVIKNILRPFSKVNATHYLACSKFAAKWLFGGTDNVVVLNNAINLNNFAFNIVARERIRDELDLNGRFVIGHVGRFVRQKNHMFLLKMLKEVVKVHHNACLLLAGEGQLLDEFKAAAKDYNLEDNIVYLGLRKDINLIMQAMDVFVLPSLYEGLPVVGIEAQASGLPCIFSDKITREVGLTDEVKFLSIEDNVERWKEAVCRYRSYDIKKRENAHAVLKKKGYDIRTEAKKLQNYYLSLIENLQK